MNVKLVKGSREYHEFYNEFEVGKMPSGKGHENLGRKLQMAS